MRVFLKIVKHQVKSFSYKENMEHTFPYEIDDMNIMKNIDNGQLYIDNNVLMLKDTIKLTLAKAASSYSQVLSKASSGGYATARGMNIALSRTGNSFFSALTGMHLLVRGAANDLAIALAAFAFTSGGYAFISGAALEW